MPLPCGWRPPSHRVPQQRPGIPLREEKERASEHWLRQNGRGGAAERGGERLRAVEGAQHERGGIHELRGHEVDPGALRDLLGAVDEGLASRSLARRAGEVLFDDGGVAEQRVSTREGLRPFYWAVGDSCGEERNLRRAYGLRHLPRRLDKPVQGATVCDLHSHNGVAGLQGGVRSL